MVHVTAARSEITVLDAVCQMFSKQRKRAREKAYEKAYGNQGRGIPGILRMPAQKIAMIGDVGHSTSDIGRH
jgi:hypothetical protein